MRVESLCELLFASRRGLLYQPYVLRDEKTMVQVISTATLDSSAR